MAFFIGNSEKRVRINGKLYDVLVPTAILEQISGRLISFDDFYLMDSNGNYLIAKESN